MSKRIYVVVDEIKYAIETKEYFTNSNYNTGITVRKIGEKMPLTGRIIERTDNVREIGKQMITPKPAELQLT